MADAPLDPRAEEVRRLLADARHTEPMPEAVVTRLDGVLADLATEPARSRPVTDLTTRRRRVTQLLVAAAAVVVLGVGIQQVVQPQSSSDSASPTAERQADAPEAQGSSGDPQPGTDSQAESGAAGAGNDASTLSGVIVDKHGLVRLEPDDFADGVSAAYAYSTQSGKFTSDRAAAVVCRAKAWGNGTFVPALYGRTPAVLVFRRPMGDTQVADLFLCGDTAPTRSVTLPAP